MQDLKLHNLNSVSAVIQVTKSRAPTYSEN